MWRDGAMICRARSGETAPPIGAQLSADTGISGECLRTGKIQNCADTENDPLVDLEVCRRLGLRSIAVLPIQGWRGINGILQVSSTKPAAFTEENIAVLNQLATLAERARAAQPHGASSSAPKPPSVIEKRKPFRLLPASDRLGDLAVTFLGTRSQPLLIGIGLIAVALFAVSMWLGWQGAEAADKRVQAGSSLERGSNLGRADIAAPTVVVVAPLSTSSADASGVPNVRAKEARDKDNDPIWRPDPGGQRLYLSNGKPSPVTPLKFAAKVDRIAKKKRPSISSTSMDCVVAGLCPAGKGQSPVTTRDGTSQPAELKTSD
jgi:hypothetical protein